MARLLSSPLMLASAAVLAGCAFLTLAGAPLRMPLMNLAALLIGLCAIKAAEAVKSLGVSPSAADFAYLTASLLVPLTALFGADIQGVSRWLVVAGITIHPGLIVVPPLVVGFALRPSAVRGAAIAIAGAGLAMQPDPAAAAMLVTGILLALPAIRPAALSVPLLVAVAAGLAVALAREVALPAVPFVEDVPRLALEAGPVAIAFAAATLCLLLLPAASAARHQRSAAFAFAGLWLAGLAAAATGPYPAPVVGFGGSAVLGYILSVALLRRPRDSAVSLEHRNETRETADEADHSVRFA